MDDKEELEQKDWENTIAKIHYEEGTTLDEFAQSFASMDYESCMGAARAFKKMAQILKKKDGSLKASEKTIDELLRKELSPEDIQRLIDKLKNGKFIVKNLNLSFPEFVRESDLGDKLKEDDKFQV